MCTLWENYSGCDLELRKYISQISDSILQRMHAGWYPGLWSERPRGNQIHLIKGASNPCLKFMEMAKTVC